MKKSLLITCIFSLVLAAFISSGCSRGGLEGKVHEFTLENGMKWFLVNKKYAPVFAGVVQVKAGGVDEVPGKTGLSHLLEHMAFKGTSSIGTTNFEAEKNIIDKIDAVMEAGGGKEEVEKLMNEQKKFMVQNELWDILTRNGANNINAYTGKDVTTYFSEMPNSKLELWAYLTSDMISDPVFREFYTERDVVMEELRTSLDNSPDGRLYKALLGNAYKKSPYSWPTIGLKEDVLRFNRNDIIDFYKAHYQPECMVGAIVGDIDIEQTRSILEKYFGPLKGKSDTCERTMPLDPPQKEEKDAIVNYDAEPMLVMAFHKPTLPNFDDYIFDVFSYVLCEGESSRMQKELVKDKKIAKSISCFNSYPGSRVENLFIVYAEPFDVISLPELKKAIMGELNRLALEPVDSKELEKVKKQMKTGFLVSIDSNFNLAHTLVYFQNLAGDWRYILKHPRNIDRIKAEDLMNTAKRYFVPENMTVVELRRKDG